MNLTYAETNEFIYKSGELQSQFDIAEIISR